MPLLVHLDSVCSLTGMKKKDITALVEEHLKDLVLKHFDPRKADRIFAEAGSVSRNSALCIIYPPEYMS